MQHAAENLPGWRGDIERFMALSFIQNFLIALIVVNAIILGVETNHEIMAAVGPELLAIDHFILWVFIAELGLLIAARRLNFFKDPWCVFDFFSHHHRFCTRYRQPLGVACLTCAARFTAH
jgi:voltage-gated sodium channel